MNKSKNVIIAATLALILAGVLGTGNWMNVSAQLPPDTDTTNKAYAEFKATAINRASERGEYSPFVLSDYEQRLLAGEKLSQNIVFVGSKQFAEGSNQLVFISSNPLVEGSHVVSRITAMGVNYEAFQQLANSDQEITTESLGEARKNLLETKYQDGIPEPMQANINALYEKFKAEQANQWN